MTRRDLPNAVTVARILLVVPLAWLIGEGRYAAALWVALVAGVSDAVDGFLAKHYHWVSRLGGILDPIADKLLLITCYVMLGLQGELPGWLVLAVVTRDIVIGAGAAIYHAVYRALEPAPTYLSKLNTVVQIVLVLAVLLDQGLAALPATAIAGLVYVVGLTTVASGVQYVWVWGWRAWQLGTHQAG